MLNSIGRPIIINDNEYLCIEHDGAFIIARDSATPKIGATVNFGGASLRIREVRVDLDCIHLTCCS